MLYNGEVMELYPDTDSWMDINSLFTLYFLTDVSFYMELEPIEEIPGLIGPLGERLLIERPNDPYLRTILGTFYDRQGDQQLAATQFEAIIQAGNFSPNCYTRDAQTWLNEH